MDGLRLTRGKYDDMAEEPSKDLLAAFSALENDVQKLVARAGREHWTIEKLVSEVDALLAPEPEEQTYS
jgi:hypothetical protein